MLNMLYLLEFNSLTERGPEPTLCKNHSPLYQFYNVVKSNEHHKGDKKEKADTVCYICNLWPYWWTFYRLYKKKEQSSAVERWEWQQVYDGEVDRDDCGERNQMYKTKSWRIAYDTHNTNWACDILNASLPD